jgi:hypothetical protein
VLIAIGNLTLFVLLLGYYLFLKKQLKKRIMYDVSYLYRFKYTITPLIVGIFNFIIFILFDRKLIPVSVFILLIPVLSHLLKYHYQRKQEKEYLILKDTIEPIVWEAINREKIFVEPGSLHIRLLDGKEKGKKKIEIVLNVPNKNPEYQSFKKNIVTELNRIIKTDYVLDLLLNIPFKKKVNLVIR